MYILDLNDEIKGYIECTKSTSGISGPTLAKAHMALGKELAKSIDLPPEETTVVAVMRGGMFLAEGIYFELGCKFETYNPKNETFNRPKTKYVIIADAVINTGKTIRGILDEDMLVACCVINEKAVYDFDERLYAARISSNSFVGSNTNIQKNGKGPDTTMRLFNQL